MDFVRRNKRIFVLDCPECFVRHDKNFVDGFVFCTGNLTCNFTLFVKFVRGMGGSGSFKIIL